MSKSFADHEYYLSDGVTDQAKIRDEAYRRSQGDYYATPESSLIHHHRQSEPCNYVIPVVDEDPNHEHFPRRL